MIRNRDRLTAAQREELWDREAAKASASGRGQFPLCRLCDCPIFPGQRWHENHNRYQPHAIGGEVDGISHERCNIDHANAIDKPHIAKVKRQRQKHIGAELSSLRPLPFGRTDHLKRKVTGEIVLRDTNQPWGRGT